MKKHRRQGRQRHTRADVEAAWYLGITSVKGHPAQHFWSVRVGGDKAVRAMRRIGSVRGMECRVAFNRGRRHGQWAVQYDRLWRAINRPAEAQP